VWSDVAQLWLVAGGSMAATATFRSPNLTCAAPLDWPSPPHPTATNDGTYSSWGWGGGLAEKATTTFYWIVGTSHGEVHVLLGDSLERPAHIPMVTARLARPGAPTLRRGRTGGVLLGAEVDDPDPLAEPAASYASCEEWEADEGHPRPSSITSLVVLKPDPKPDEPRATAKELAEAALVVGFDDGAVRQYRLVDFLVAACP